MAPFKGDFPGALTFPKPSAKTLSPKNIPWVRPPSTHSRIVDMILRPLVVAKGPLPDPYHFAEVPVQRAARGSQCSRQGAGKC